MLTGISSRIRELFAPSFALTDIKGFPYEVYRDQLSVYQECENWYTGAAIEAAAGTRKGTPTDPYPVRINPIRRTAQKHAYMLYGETEGMVLQVIPKLKPRNDGEKEACAYAEEVLTDVWDQNNGRALLAENALLSQIFGGCIFKAAYTPWDVWKWGGSLEHPIRIEAIHPRDAVLIPEAANPYSLTEAWIVKQIRAQEARAYGYDAADEDIYYWYIEHWTKKDFTVMINEKVAVKRLGQELPLGGTNPYGVIPIVYIPHIRDGRFYGSNVLDDLKGIVLELNLRLADYGDAVNDDAHPLVAMHDVNGTPKFVTINDWLEVLNLNSTNMLTGNEVSPDIFEVRKTRTSSAMKDLVLSLSKEFRRAAYVPAVADGEDEGSQRSAMTLAVRFWPLISHAGTERDFWTPGFIAFQRILLRMLSTKNLAGITEQHCKLRMKLQWASMLPQDRQGDVQEWNLRKTSEIASMRHLITQSGDVEDVDAEREEILKDITDVETIKAKIAKEYAPEPIFQQGGPPKPSSSGGKENDKPKS